MDLRPKHPGQTQSTASWFRPGYVAERSGVYRVHHYQHRLPHSVIIRAGTVLPKCNLCGEKVQFTPIFAAEPYEVDRDFRLPETGTDKRND